MTTAEHNRAYYLAHAEERRAKARARYAANPEKIKEINRATRQRHLEEYRQRDRTYRKSHKEQRRASDRAYVESNREKVTEYQRCYSKEHADEMSAYLTKRRAADPFRVTAIQMMAAIRFRTRQSGIPRDDTFLTVAMLTNLFERSPACSMCRVALDYGPKGRGRGAQWRNNSPSVDRFVPERGYVVGNLDVLCRLCNTRKNNHTLESAKLLVEYLERRSSSEVSR